MRDVAPAQGRGVGLEPSRHARPRRAVLRGLPLDFFVDVLVGRLGAGARGTLPIHAAANQFLDALSRLDRRRARLGLPCDEHQLGPVGRGRHGRHAAGCPTSSVGWDFSLGHSSAIAEAGFRRASNTTSVDRQFLRRSRRLVADVDWIKDLRWFLYRPKHAATSSAGSSTTVEDRPGSGPESATSTGPRSHDDALLDDELLLMPPGPEERTLTDAGRSLEYLLRRTRRRGLASWPSTDSTRTGPCTRWGSTR